VYAVDGLLRVFGRATGRRGNPTLRDDGYGSPMTEPQGRTNADILGIDPALPPVDASDKHVKETSQESRSRRLRDLLLLKDQEIEEHNLYEEFIESAGYDYSGKEQWVRAMARAGRL